MHVAGGLVRSYPLNVFGPTLPSIPQRAGHDREVVVRLCHAGALIGRIAGVVMEDGIERVLSLPLVAQL